ncbi:Protein of unknown function [Cotesia congregata]|uniref:Uncharacterized protein n=1 Tax=Cotesia congregata TaxID=51543 RepID=A0A8J2MR95_COTCN|nr:Protein of unknown function [Cotesia congregata]
MAKLVFDPVLKKYLVARNHARTSRKCLLLGVNSYYENLVDISNKLNRGLPKLRLARIGYSSGKAILNKNFKHDIQRDSSQNDIFKHDDDISDDSFNVEETIKIKNSVHESSEISSVKKKINNKETYNFQKTFDDVFYEELHKELRNQSDIMRMESVVSNTTTKNCCLIHDEESMISQQFDAPKLREQDQRNLCANIKDEVLLHSNKKANNNSVIDNQLDQAFKIKQNSKDKVIIQPELQDNDTDMINKSYKKRSNEDIHRGYGNDEASIHKKATIREIAEVNKVQLCQDMEGGSSGLLSRQLENGNNRVVPIDYDRERQFEFEDALLPDNLNDIQTLYDSEKDILQYSSNYEVHFVLHFKNII